MKTIIKKSHFIIGFCTLLCLAVIFDNYMVSLLSTWCFVLLLVGGILWRILKMETGKYIEISSFTILFAIYTLYLGITLFLSPLPLYSLDRFLIKLFLFIAFTFFTFFISEKHEAEEWEDAFVVVILFLSLFEVLSIIHWYLKWYVVKGTFFSPSSIGFRLPGIFFPGANHTAGFINLILPLVILRYLLNTSKSKRIFWGITLIYLLFIEYYTSSRAGWISALAGLCTMFILFYLPQLINKTKSKNFLVSRRGFLICFLGIIIIFSIGFLFSRQVHITPGHSGLLSGRLNIWANSIAIWSRSYLFGNGVGSFPLLYAQQAKLPPGFFPDHAHNMWIHAGVETGILGILIIIGMIALMGIPFMFNWNKYNFNKETRGKYSAYAGIFISLLLNILVAEMFNYSFFALCVLLLLWLSTIFFSLSKTIKVPKAISILLLCCITILFLFGQWFTLRGYDEYQKGLNEMEDGSWQSGREALCQGANKYPYYSVYAFQCGTASGYLSKITNSTDLNQFAVQMYREGLENDPYWSVHWANLSLLEWNENGDSSKVSISHMKEAFNAAPRNALFAFNLGWMEEQLGNIEEAHNAYNLALQNDPWLQVSPLFSDSSLHVSVASDIEYEDDFLESSDYYAIKGYREMLLDNYGNAANNLDIALHLNPRNAEAYSIIGLIAQINDLPKDAWVNAQTAIILDDDNPYVLTCASQIAQAQNNETKAQEYIEKAFSYWRKGIEDSETYYLFVYHRLVLPFYLVPGFQRPDITYEMIEGFLWLAEQYEQDGEHEKAKDVRIWLDYLDLANYEPKGFFDISETVNSMSESYY